MTLKVPQIRILNLHWGAPLTAKVYKEIGVVMTEILPYLHKVEFADDEGAILHLMLSEEQEEHIKELRKELIYIDVWFEEEDYEQLKKQRLVRWAQTKLRRKEE
jgi:hypothetical protein